MDDPLKALFMPLALAVGFAMISSYLLSSTFVPVMAVWLLKENHHEHKTDKLSLFERVEKAYEGLVHYIVKLKWIVVPSYIGLAGVCLTFFGSMLGQELFPKIDSGQFVLRFRPPQEPTLKSHA